MKKLCFYLKFPSCAASYVVIIKSIIRSSSTGSSHSKRKSSPPPPPPASHPATPCLQAQPKSEVRQDFTSSQAHYEGELYRAFPDSPEYIPLSSLCPRGPLLLHFSNHPSATGTHLLACLPVFPSESTNPCLCLGSTQNIKKYWITNERTRRIKTIKDENRKWECKDIQRLLCCSLSYRM